MKLKIIFFLLSVLLLIQASLALSNTLSTKDSHVFMGKDSENPSEIIRIKPPLQNATPSVTMPSIEIKPQIVLPTPWYNGNFTKE